jgi:hypothetical protein
VPKQTVVVGISSLLHADLCSPAPVGSAAQQTLRLAGAHKAKHLRVNMGPDQDCQLVYYVKQLSPSDAACSKQIKLPKTEAKRFVGELRHKQSTALVSSQTT